MPVRIGPEVQEVPRSLNIGRMVAGSPLAEAPWPRNLQVPSHITVRRTWQVPLSGYGWRPPENSAPATGAARVRECIDLAAADRPRSSGRASSTTRHAWR